MGYYYSYYNYERTGRYEIRLGDKPIRSHDNIIYQTKEIPCIDNIKLEKLIKNRKYGMYSTVFVSNDNSFKQLQGINITPYKREIQPFNICSFYPRWNTMNLEKSVIGHLIDPKIASQRSMISHEFESNFHGHSDILANFKWPKDDGGLKLIYFYETFGIVSDEMVNRYYASKVQNDWITEMKKKGLVVDFKYHNHELAGDGAVIALRGDIRFNNINNKSYKEAVMVEEAANIGLNLKNHHYERPIYVLNPKLNHDLSIYAINSEYQYRDNPMPNRKNKTIVIDINENCVLELMTWNEGIKFIEERKSILQTIPDNSC